MAPINFEEHIREKLQEREMTPSPETWKRLEGQLETNNSSSNTGIIWWAIAASLITLLVVGSLLFTKDGVEAGPVVETEQIQPTETIRLEQPISTEETTAEEVAVETEVTTDRKMDNADAVKPASANKPTPVLAQTQVRDLEQAQFKEKPVAENPSQEVVATLEKTEADVTESLIEKQPSFEQAKVDEVVAKVLAMQNENQEVTAEAVDALLATAQRDIANRRLLQQSTTRIDPSALLQEVETEMERSFRDKVFEALGEGFVKVRTAVAERNN